MAVKKKKVGRITAEMFYKHLRCPHWVYWDLYGDESDKAETNALMQRIWEHGIAHEKEYISSYGEFVEVAEYGDEDELFNETVAHMAAGARAIYHGRLIDGTWAGIPDLLVKTSLPLGRRSRFGDYHYVPYDIKSANIKTEKDIRPEYKFQLAFYSLVLEKIQGVRPETGHIIDANKVTHDVPIGPVLEEFHLTLREIEKIIDGQKPAPFLASACKESPWFGLCKKDAEACDDVCLIYKIKRADHAKLYEAGIRTVTELATTEIDTLVEAVPEMSRRKLEAIKRQARALHEKKVIVIQGPELPQSTVEVYFDIEGDPLRNLEYLFGLLVTDGPKDKGTYTYFLAETPDDEEKAWHEFLKFVKKLPADARIYHYGTYEKTVATKLKEKYGGDAATIDRLENEMVNLLTTVCESVALPVYFYSLKDIAKELGFKWRHKAAGGANSITWYEQYLELKERNPKSVKGARVLQDIIDYNEDDVRATLHLKRWLDALPEPD